MKRKLLFIFIVLIAFSSSLFADMDFVIVGTSGGFSNINNTPSFGFNTAYHYMASVSNNFYFGVASHSDLNIQIHDKVDVGVGAMVGPSFGFCENASNFTAFTIAPSMYMETKSDTDSEYLGFGLGLDLNHTFYFGSDNDFGLTLGTTHYITFGNVSEKPSNGPVGYDGLGYIAFSFRSGDYTGSQNVYYDFYL